jgi:uncharacterized protein YaiL (DUF2058 family)
MNQGRQPSARIPEMDRRRAETDARKDDRNRAEQRVREEKLQKKQKEKREKDEAKPPADCYLSGSKWTKQHMTHLNVKFADNAAALSMEFDANALRHYISKD